MKNIKIIKNLNRLMTVITVVIFAMIIWNIVDSINNGIYYNVFNSKEQRPIYGVEKVLKDDNNSIYIKTKESNSIEIFDSKGEYGGSILVSMPFDFKIDYNSILTLAVLETDIEDKNEVWISKEYFFCNDVHNISAADPGGTDVYQGSFEEYLEKNGYSQAPSEPYKQCIGRITVDDVVLSYPLFPFSSTVLLIALCMVIALKILFSILKHVIQERHNVNTERNTGDVE